MSQQQQRRFILHINRQSSSSSSSVWTYFEAHDFSNLPQNLQVKMKEEYDFQQEIGSSGKPTGIWYKAVRDGLTAVTVNDSPSTTNNNNNNNNDDSSRSSHSSPTTTWQFAMTLQRTIGYNFINQTEREKCYRGESATMELVL